MTHPLVRKVRQALREAANRAKAPQMQAYIRQAYMKSAMPYRGVSASDQRKVWRHLFPAHSLTSAGEWRDVALTLWREAKFRTVLAATGELPSGLVDVRLEDCDGLSREIREAGKALLYQLRGSGNRVVSQTVALDGRGRSLQLVAIEALAIRRTATDVRGLLTSKLAVISFEAAVVDVTLSVEVADDVPAVVPVDSEKVAWAVTTLVGNALRYDPR